jgi:hypothetical protein
LRFGKAATIGDVGFGGESFNVAFAFEGVDFFVFDLISLALIEFLVNLVSDV